MSSLALNLNHGPRTPKCFKGTSLSCRAERPPPPPDSPRCAPTHRPPPAPPPPPRPRPRPRPPPRPYATRGTSSNPRSTLQGAAESAGEGSRCLARAPSRGPVTRRNGEPCLFLILTLHRHGGLARARLAAGRCRRRRRARSRRVPPVRAPAPAASRATAAHMSLVCRVAHTRQHGLPAARRRRGGGGGPGRRAGTACGVPTWRNELASSLSPGPARRLHRRCLAPGRHCRIRGIARARAAGSGL